MTIASKTLALLMAGVLAVSACSGKPQTSAGGTDRPEDETVIELGSDEIVLTARLVRFDDCDALLDRLRSDAAERVGPWGFGPERYATGGIEEEGMPAEAAEDAGDVADSAASSPAAQAPALVEGVDYSGTNVQEAGVDEADIIKTDGRRIFVMSAGRLVVVDASSREILGSVRVADARSAELFLHGDSLLAIYDSRGRDYEGPETTIQRIDVRGGIPEIIETMSV